MIDKEHAQRAADTIAVMQTIVSIAAHVSLEDCDNVQAMVNHYDTVMPILDPTAWMKTAANADDNKEAIGAFIQFRRRIDKLIPKTNEPAATAGPIRP